jgi:hypothetical protein
MKLWSLVPVLLLGSVVAACGTIYPRNPVPQTDNRLAEIPGMENVRFWGDETPDFVINRMRNSSAVEIRAEQPGIVDIQHHYLAISGGGQDGAFGAGLLNGWSATGTRPEFTMVTGISTGALSAPFAFLGPDYDKVLTEIYTAFKSDDLVESRLWTVIATGDAAVDTAKLRALIDRYVDHTMLFRLSEEYRRGRRLFIGTTNLDALRPVIWNITAIANSGAPNARELIVDVLMASASIPGAFPPVFIDVERDGETYDEIHVDGGAVQQAFVYPSTIDWPAILEKLGTKGRPQVYIIRNSLLKPHWKPVEAGIFTLTKTALSSLIRTQGIGDLNRIYLVAQRDGADFNLAHIPDGFSHEPQETFDQAYMTALYDLGYAMAKDGFPWLTEPPDSVATPFN